MLGAAIGAGLSIAGSIAGGIAAANERKKLKKAIKGQMDENQDWYDRNYNEDYTQRADAQRILTATEDAVRKRNKAAAGAQAVMGGTEESVAAAKAANNAALADTASRIAAAGEARKHQVENQYLNRKEALQGQLNSLSEQKAQGIAQAIQGVGNAAGSIATAIDSTAKPAGTDSSVKEGKNGQLDTSAIVEQNQKALSNPFVQAPKTGKSRVTQDYMGNLQTNPIAAQNQAATAAWMDEMARRYGQSIWDAK